MQNAILSLSVETADRTESKLLSVMQPNLVVKCAEKQIHFQGYVLIVQYAAAEFQTIKRDRCKLQTEKERLSVVGCHHKW